MSAPGVDAAAETTTYNAILGDVFRRFQRMQTRKQRLYDATEQSEIRVLSRLLRDDAIDLANALMVHDGPLELRPA